MRLALLALVATLAASAAAAQSEGGGLLVVSPVPRLAHDAGLGERADVQPDSSAGQQTRGAWRGAKRGFLVGAAISGVAVVGVLVVLRDKGEFIPLGITMAAAVPLTAVTTLAGAIIGSARARPGRVPPPAAAPGGDVPARP